MPDETGTCRNTAKRKKKLKTCTGDNIHLLFLIHASSYLVGFDRLKRLFYPSRYQFQRILIHSSSLLRGLCRPIQWVRHTMDKRSESQLVYGVTSVEAFQLLRIEFMDVPSVA
eukprot:gb/GECG01015510.1/.p1 GENE.gb/GECG01015510.1/~~gb/GECG01015510.1/.p1  ORF type:complete len:113 (+),score=4.37 gb/GECG01015510.1/:1-339(+)